MEPLKVMPSSIPERIEPKKPLQLSREEMLELENYFLKIENLRLQQERQQKEIVEAGTMAMRLQKELGEKRTELSKKYGVDLSRARIDAHGVITPPGA